MTGNSPTSSTPPKRKRESDHLKRDDHLREKISRQEHIAKAAYYKAERRGFSHGMAMQDWLEAEAEFDARENRGSAAQRET